MKILPVILCGGSGTRLWPLSRAGYPKQFLSIFDKNSMLQETVNRLTTITNESPISICNEEHRFIVAEQLREVDKLGPIVLEPEGRNTAPAIALAAKMAISESSVDFESSGLSDVLSDSDDCGKEDPLLLVLAADHLIKDCDVFSKTVAQAIPLAKSGLLVTFGIVPTSAHTGYGYIRRGEILDVGFKVSSFVEKPTPDLAEEYLSSGKYYWNSGMFLFRASRYLEELRKYRPDILSACSDSFAQSHWDMDFVRVGREAFSSCPTESIDYAVMEKTKDAVVIPMEAGWSDIGSWSSLWEVSDKDEYGNVKKGDVITHDSQNCLVHASERLVATVGLSDIVVIDTKDAVLVADKECVQDVKVIVEKLKESGKDEYKLHREVYRPWGKYDSVDAGQRYQVKRITVKPGAKLSVQMHHHRAEHWIVVSGTAKVTNGDKTFLVTENESTYIPVGVIHALENPGKVPLELIEVQSGSYLGEDDIVRFEDLYGRVEN